MDPIVTASAKAGVAALAKPAATLIEKCSRAVGSLYEPTRVRRLAKADGDAAVIAAEAASQVAVIEANSQIAVEDLKRRATTRRLQEDIREQRNMEAIFEKTLLQLPETSQPQDMEDDWITKFFQHARHVSDEQMQQLWARILAGESTATGSFSRKTLQVVADLSREDGEKLQKLCRFVVSMTEGLVTVIFWNDLDFRSVYQNAGCTFNDLVQLESLGLVRFDGSSGYSTDIDAITLDVVYGGETLTLFPSGRAISIGAVMLTEAGWQLAPICKGEPVPAFLEMLKVHWQAMLTKPTTPGANPAPV